MSEARLDQAIKGAPPPNVDPEKLASAARRSSTSLKGPQPPLPPSDPLSTLPSSPPQIYLNLLILEASLRAQYLTLRARRRQHTFVLLLLGLWNAYFLYAYFLRPREDGKGIGGSVYWMVDVGEKVALMGGILTVILMWATGQWERGVRWPRRWIGIANRGLRGMNCKIVVLKGPLWRETLSHLSILFPYSSFFPSGSSYHYIDHTILGEKHSGVDDLHAEEDIAPGGDYIKLLLLPKPFSPDFRENWEIYRTEYWERENERRAELRKKVKRRQRELAKAEGGWLWWTGWYLLKRKPTTQPDLESVHHHRHHHSIHHQHSNSNLSAKDGRRRRPSVLRDGSHSRSSSRSTTPTPEMDDRISMTSDRPRRGSSVASTASDRRRRKPPTSNPSGPSGTGRGLSENMARLTPSGSRPGTPTKQESFPALSKRASSLSTASSTHSVDSERSSTTAIGEDTPDLPRKDYGALVKGEERSDEA